mgnify:CR=1 FL=1
MGSEADQLALLLRVNAILHSTQSLEDVLQELIVQVSQTLRAERGFVVLRQPEGEWRPVAAHSLDASKLEESTRYSRTIVETVASSGQALLTSDALDNFGNISSITLQGIRSILCAPLRWRGQVQGVVYADHSVKAGIFTISHLQLLEAIADQASRTLETAALHEELRKIHQTQAQMGVPKVVDSVLDCLRSGQVDPPQDPSPMLGPRIDLFGPLRVQIGERSIQDWATRKDRDLFAYLAAHRGQVVHEDKLMDLFWSQGGKNGRHSLHNSITQIRKTLGDTRREIVLRKLDGYSLAAECWTDIEEFAQAYRRGKEAVRKGLCDEAIAELSRAESLAERSFLEGSEAEWIDPLRLRLSQQTIECRNLLAEDFRNRGKHLLAIELWNRVLEHDRCCDSAYRGLIDAYRELGRMSEATRVYQACVKAYREELDLEPPGDLSLA